MSCVGFKHKCNKDFKGHVCEECQERWRDGKPVPLPSPFRPRPLYTATLLFLTIDGQIRVVRSNMAKEYGPQSKTKVYRYDGLYKVVDYWTEKGKSGKSGPGSLPPHL